MKLFKSCNLLSLFPKSTKNKNKLRDEKYKKKQKKKQGKITFQKKLKVAGTKCWDNLQSKLKSITQNKIYTDLKENSNLVYTYKVIAE